MMGRRLLFSLVVLAGLVALAAPAGASHDLTELLSTGPAGGNGAFPANYAAASSDGGRVFFQTSEALVGADGDARIDVYERAGGATALISTGPAGGNGAFDATLAGVSRDGSRVFIATRERLAAPDADSQFDVYERVGGTTTLVSTGSAGGNGAQGAFFDGASADGGRVFFHTREGLLPGDADGSIDVYERSAGTTTLVSGGSGAFDVFFGGNTDDGAHVYYETNEAIAAGDADAAQDVYDRSTLVSTGPAGGNGASPAFFDGSSADGAHAFFTTDERLVGADTDSQFDVYDRSGGTTDLVSTGPAGGNGASDALFDGASADGSRVFFETDERLTTGDTDSQRDIYERAGTTTLVSGGSGAFDAAFDGASADGTHVFFETEEALTGADADAAVDIYERAGGVTTLVSTGPAGGNGTSDAVYGGISKDGARAFFATDEPLVAADADTSADVYERAAGVTTLVSTGPSGGNGAFGAAFADASDDGSRVFFETSEQLVAADTDTSLDLYSATTGGAYARPKGATPLRASLVPAFDRCTAPNRQHGAPLAFGSCAAPAQSSSALTVGTPDANGVAASSNGFVLLEARVGDPSTAADEADAGVTVSISDVRRRSDLSDYAGELQAVLATRITDRASGSGGGDPATVTDTTVPATVPCTVTASTTVGSTCALSTSVDALVPGAVREGARAIWQLDQIQVLDGGTDGLASTGPNQPFMRQGVFVP